MDGATPDPSSERSGDLDLVIGAGATSASTHGASGRDQGTGGPEADLEAGAVLAAEVATSAGGRGAVSLAMLGFVVLCLGGLLSWGQDATAPYVNLGEAEMPGPITFEADQGTYKVITSGPLRPAIQFTGCTITLADGNVITDRGIEGSEGGRERFGVTRVLEFDAVAGTTEMRCGTAYGERSPGGRFQVVAARGPVTYTIWGLWTGGTVLLVGGILWFVVHMSRSSSRT